jgi:hypothetical protein
MRYPYVGSTPHGRHTLGQEVAGLSEEQVRRQPSTDLDLHTLAALQERSGDVAGNVADIVLGRRVASTVFSQTCVRKMYSPTRSPSMQHAVW